MDTPVGIVSGSESSSSDESSVTAADVVPVSCTMMSRPDNSRCGDVAMTAADTPGDVIAHVAGHAKSSIPVYHGEL